jgi:hypothetical protein
VLVPAPQQVVGLYVAHEQGVHLLLEGLGHAPGLPTLLRDAVTAPVFADGCERVEERRGVAPPGDLPREAETPDLFLERIPVRFGHELRHQLPPTIDDLVEAGTHPRDRRLRRGSDRLRGEVDVGVLDQHAEQVEQRRRTDPGHSERLEGGILIAYQPFEVPFPEDAPQRDALVGGEFLETGVEPHIEGALPQEASAKRVDGADERLIHVVKRGPEPLVHRGATLTLPGRGPRLAFQLRLKALAQLGGCLARERHGRDLTNLSRARSEERDHSIDQLRRLPGTRAGFDQQVGFEVVRDPPPGGGVAKTGRGRHGIGHGSNLVLGSPRGKVRAWTI